MARSLRRLNHPFELITLIIVLPWVNTKINTNIQKQQSLTKHRLQTTRMGTLLPNQNSLK
jgi:hypothetical protein